MKVESTRIMPERRIRGQLRIYSTTPPNTTYHPLDAIWRRGEVYVHCDLLADTSAAQSSGG
jgi:hypothetical protein